MTMITQENLMACPISLLPILRSEAELITRTVDLPAMLRGPLFRTMFPTWKNFTPVDAEEMAQWYIEGLEEALEDPRNEIFFKACQIKGQDEDLQAFPVGFCGWETIDRSRPEVILDSHVGDEADVGQSTIQDAKNLSDSVNTTGKENKKKRLSLPDTLDVDNWIALSKVLRTERQRVLKNLSNVCRLTFMAVHPDFQKQGIGSMVMQRICEETDRCLGRFAYVLAAPEGVRLYKKFGFEVVGQVETPYGNITSMLRAPLRMKRNGV